MCMGYGTCMACILMHRYDFVGPLEDLHAWLARGGASHDAAAATDHGAFGRGALARLDIAAGDLLVPRRVV